MESEIARGLAWQTREQRLLPSIWNRLDRVVEVKSKLIFVERKLRLRFSCWKEKEKQSIEG